MIKYNKYLCSMFPAIEDYMWSQSNAIRVTSRTISKCNIINVLIVILLVISLKMSFEIINDHFMSVGTLSKNVFFSELKS